MRPYPSGKTISYAANMKSRKARHLNGLSTLISKVDKKHTTAPKADLYKGKVTWET